MDFLISPSPYPPIVWISMGLAVVLLPLIVMLAVRRRKDRQSVRQAPESGKGVGDNDEADEIPPEVLVTILTAAAVSVLGEEKSDLFRVVSFRRVK